MLVPAHATRRSVSPRYVSNMYTQIQKQYFAVEHEFFTLHLFVFGFFCTTVIKPFPACPLNSKAGATIESTDEFVASPSEPF